MFLLNISELLEEYTRKKTKSQLKDSLAINVDKVWLVKTGESLAVNKGVGDSVYAGTVVEDGVIIISAMREASTNNVMVKGGKFLEELSKADTIVFDKTGTLTVASPEVEKVVAHGIASHINEEKVIVGSAHFVFEDEGVELSEENKKIIEEEGNGYSIIYLAVGGKAAGFICINDPVREESKDIINELRNLGIDNVIMLTGDGEQTAASVSIAMKDGSDIAREVADITLMEADLRNLIFLRRLSVGVMDKISKNYKNILIINTSLLLLGVCGCIRPTTAAVLHNASTMLISAASMKPCLENK